eukprot:jgi/Mesen1/6637/ME000034S06086
MLTGLDGRLDGRAREQPTFPARNDHDRRQASAACAVPPEVDTFFSFVYGLFYSHPEMPRRLRRVHKSPDPLEEQRLARQGELGGGGLFG